MSAATIVFTDIVGFSKKPTAEQKRLVTALTGEVIYELRVLLNPPLDTPGIVALPTGDGVALAFLHRSTQPWDRATIFRLIFRLQKWASDEKGVSLRVGIHVGPVELVTDINGKTNVCGDTINYAQRVMDAANPRQVLFSETALREYVGTEERIVSTPPFSKDLTAEFQGPIEVYAKHGLQMLVYKMTLPLLTDQHWWSNEDPIAKQLMIVTLTPLPKEIGGSFGERLERATQIAFIQLTGCRFLEGFEGGSIRLSTSLKRFWVFMPNPQIYSQLHLSRQYASEEFVNQCVVRWRNVFGNLREQNPEADLKLGLFNESPYFGASFVDWERPGGIIHVSPYVWGVPTRDCPGYDLQWLGKKPSPVYEVYATGLQYLHAQTANAAFET